MNDCQTAEKQMDGQAEIKACLRYISGEECVNTKALWQEVFSEDSQLFTDYYFRVKAPRNEGFVLEGEEGLRAMLFLTPEKMRVFEEQVQSAYIVGVATKACWRHRGYMKRLLNESFSMLYKRKMPFVFLMPASAAIYEPFEFRFIYDRPVWDTESLHIENLKPLGEAYIGKIADFSQACLKENAAVHICRDAAYDKVLLEEIAAQEGCVLGYFEQEELSARGKAKSGDLMRSSTAGCLRGICLYTCEDGEADIQEVLAMPDKEKQIAVRLEEKKPCIMARIIHLPSMLALLRTADSQKEVSFWLQVTDSQIAENNGSYLCWADGNGCCVHKVEEIAAIENADAGYSGAAGSGKSDQQSEKPFIWSGSTAQLVQRLFGYKEVEGQQEEIWKHLRLLKPVWINEIV